jgi:hypothetical protein
VDVVDYEWTVTVKGNFPAIKEEGKVADFSGGNFEETFHINSPKRYYAVSEALELFIEKNKLPFRVYQLLNKYKDFVEISAKCSEDGRVRI